MIRSILGGAILVMGVLGLFLLANPEEKSVWVVRGNMQKEPLEIVLERYFCSENRVPILELHNTAQAIKPNGETYFFADVGSLFLWLDRQKDKEEMTLWVYAQDTERYVPAQGAWYSRIDVTPMGYGFGAYEFHIYGLADYYYEEVQQLALRGETLWYPMVRQLLVENRL
ncbi:hypothetical protein [Wolinella succinogenes]|uniref:Uncharacterized protein n=1 Tax=Wolinella succinogenes (strain ATCC 29543 / DSM 1740 / CCUG 13145 / JCM 31913 / LMG 7466 / NCTC 11488 / FDC 602W) TaxID=273121 RepID=Q7MSJ2_WOLSU|nr:hypothetical protein [Wolinella succinogenes]NLU33669.1 hypothetical protein [Wolinella succinogenes]CAE09538.1 hypothetical protein WS0392 [Wolinella succinogenes]HCZ18344.1 hypothetical protein [Helicobacter sp.]